MHRPGTYARTEKHTAWMRQPWTCPKCNVTMPHSGGKGTHLRFCDPMLDVENFNAKVQVGRESDCWPFMGARVPAGGYGRARLNKRLHAAHRIAYMLAYGTIPEGLDIMHLCDNPPCCNPKHLRAATTAENMQDCKAKGRLSAPGAKLDAGVARQILDLRRVERAEDVAARFKVSISTVHNIWTGKAWKQLREAA